ncbi:hypothetical protein [Aneurinibacillus uraniidurans]|uniref:hypothetical protein n=1 Tax=Aneurinibacillus uraniidurans TaxID=2966586 RepID=UPI0023494761|nr:hypothetical protein [Aneurinibacillus sp. B1]WCN38821.1 hypothetical protein PO771_05325 [Aneurinibacillus sp. B1]
MLKKRLLTLSAFLLALTVALSAGSYQKARANERGSFTLSLPSCHEQTVLLDVAGQGLPKQLLQPDQVQISGSFNNTGTQPIPLQIRLIGFPEGTRLNASESIFDKTTGQLTQPLAPKTKFSCKLLITLPSHARDHYRMVEAAIDVYRSDTHTKLTSIPVYIVNSEIPDAHPISKPETKDGHNH